MKPIQQKGIPVRASAPGTRAPRGSSKRLSSNHLPATPVKALPRKSNGATMINAPEAHALSRFEPQVCQTCQSGVNEWIRSWLEWYRD